ncbi:MAG: phage minor head protein [Pyrinomonadaceae bacterium]
MSALDEHLKKHRRRLIEREEAAVRELLAAYDTVEKTLRREVRELEKKIADAKAAGETISPSWLFRERRLSTLLDQVKREIDEFGRIASAVITREQNAAVILAIDQARETVELFTRSSDSVGALLNPRNVETAVGMLGDGSPLLEYYEKNLTPSVVSAIRREIVEGVATGKPFSAIAKQLRAAGDITRSRSLTVARTEVNRVRRETTRQFYQDNSDVFTHWEWVSAKSVRTCPACLAMDGMTFKLEEAFPQHINCRCTMIPVIEGVDRPKRTLGTDWFDDQPAGVKEEILGQERFEAFSRGEFTLKEIVGWRTSKEFGKSIYTKSLSQIVAGNGLSEHVAPK